MKMGSQYDFRKDIESIAKSKGSVVSVFADFMRMSACAVAYQSREPEYFEAIKGYSKQELYSFSKALAHLTLEMEQKPFSDLVGEYYQQIASKSTRDNRGEFYTPEHVSSLIARITIDPKSLIETNKPVSMYEPTCGGGGMILQTAKLLAPESLDSKESYVDLLRATAQDLSPIACDMTYFNTTMWGIPTEVIHGNTLTNEVHSTWYNIHWHRVGEDYRRMFNQYSQLESIAQQHATPFEEEQQRSTTQYDLDLSSVKQSYFDLS